MKNILLASTAALVLTAGYAAAEVTVTGDARMGILETFDFTEDEDGFFEGDDFEEEEEKPKAKPKPKAKARPQPRQRRSPEQKQRLRPSLL